MVDFMTSVDRGNLYAGMGIGKSSALLMAHEVMKTAGEWDGVTLIVAPARVARDTWTDEVAKWTQFKDLEIVPLVGSPTERAKLLKLDRPIFTISYESLPWLVAQWMAKWPYKNVIADESDRLKGFRLNKGGMRAHSIGRVAHTIVKRWFNFTGTPSPNGLTDLWGQMWYVDRGARLGRTFTDFQRRWFVKNYNGFGVEPQKFADEQIHAAIKDVSLTVDPKDYFDLKEPNVMEVKIKLPAAARKIYAQLEKEMFVKFSEMENDHITAVNAAALTNKCLQLANGAVYVEYPAYKVVHDEKIEALKSIQSQSSGTPLLVAVAFKSDKERLLKAFKGSVDLSDPKGMALFRKAGAPIGLAHPASMGHGIDGLQQVTNILVRFGHDWNLGSRMQMLERIGPMRQLQGGYDRPVLVYDIIAEDTMDEECIAAHIAKRGVQDALLLACKRRAE